MSAKQKDSPSQPLASGNGYECMTSCINPGISYFHPLLLGKIKGQDTATCAINPIVTFKEGKNEIEGIDVCDLEDNLDHQIPNEIGVMLRGVLFTPEYLLKQIYKLNNFDKVIRWTQDNEKLPFNTIRRVHNAAWKAYGNNFEQLPDVVIQFYYNIVKEIWFKDYIPLLEKSYTFEVIGSDQKLYDVIHKILDEHFTYAYFNTILKDYYKQYEKMWPYVDSHYGNLKNYVYLKIQELLEKNK
jgi:hypothetical protein